MATQREREKKKARYTSSRKYADEQDKGFEPTAVKLPDGVPFFQLKKEGFYKIDIIPYIVGKGNPNADEGMAHFERSYYTHRGLGIDGKSSYCCLVKTFGKKCPVCDWMLKHGNTADPDLIAALRPKYRQLYCLINREDKDKGIQVWETPYFKSFGQLLKDKILAVEDYEDFFHLQGGMTLQISVAQESFAGGKFMAVKNIEMLRRKEDYDDDLLEQAPCLDECLVELPYKELQDIFFQGQGMDSGKSSSSKDDDDEGEEPEEDSEPEPEDEDDDEKEVLASDKGLEVGDKVTYDDKECEIKKISGDGTSLTLEDEDGDIIRAVDPADVKKLESEEDEPEEEEDEPPVKKNKTKVVEEDEDEEEPEEDSEPEPEEEEDEPPVKKPVKKPVKRK